jgi:hypothetical protein
MNCDLNDAYRAMELIETQISFNMNSHRDDTAVMKVAYNLFDSVFDIINQSKSR